MVEHFINHWASKLAVFVIFIIAGIVMTIVRMASKVTGKAFQNALINKLKRGTTRAVEVAEELDFPYGRAAMSRETFDGLIKKVRSIGSLGPYKVLYTTNVGTDGLLVLTEVTYVDYRITVKGKADDIEVTTFFNFVLKYDKKLAQMNVSSTGYMDSIEKLRKQEFLMHLNQLIES